MPDVDELDDWIEWLSPYSLHTIALAFNAYFNNEPRFSPSPAAICHLCKLADGRPGEEEAWAIAVTSLDEANTVVWTSETFEAFNVCRSVFQNGGAIAARKAFTEAYCRLVAASRLRNTPVTWSASLGWDLDQRKAVLKKANELRQLDALSTTRLLPPPAPDVEEVDEPAIVARLQKLKEVLQTLIPASKRIEMKKEEEALLAIEKDRRDKAAVSELVNNYQERQPETHADIERQ